MTGRPSTHADAGHRVARAVLAGPAGASGRPQPAGRGPRDRSRRGRWWVHRTLGRGAGGGGAARPRHRAAGGRADRRGRVGSQRRVLRGQPHPRPGQRPRAVHRRAAHPAADGPRHPGRDRGGRRPARDRLRLRAQRRARRRHRPLAGRRPDRGARPGPERLGLGWRLLDRDQVQAEVASPTYLARSTTRTAWPWSTRPGWPGGWRRRRSGSAYASSSTPRPRLWTATAPASGSAPRTAGSARPGPWWPRRPGGRVRRSIGAYVVPVWDYALMTEPLAPDVRASLGWARRQGIGDAPNKFHYYRSTAGRPAAVRRLRRPLLPGWRHRPAASPAPGDLHGPGRAPGADFPAAGRRRDHARLGRAHRHLQPVQRVLAPDARRTGGVHRRLHRPRRRGVALRGPDGAGPARRPRHRADQAGHGAVASRSRSRRSRCAGPASSSPGRRWPAPTATAAAATSGSAPWTGPVWASTADPSSLERVSRLKTTNEGRSAADTLVCRLEMRNARQPRANGRTRARPAAARRCPGPGSGCRRSASRRGRTAVSRTAQAIISGTPRTSMPIPMTKMPPSGPKEVSVYSGSMYAIDATMKAAAMPIARRAAEAVRGGRSCGRW